MHLPSRLSIASPLRKSYNRNRVLIKRPVEAGVERDLGSETTDLVHKLWMLGLENKLVVRRLASEVEDKGRQGGPLEVAVAGGSGDIDIDHSYQCNGLFVVRCETLSVVLDGRNWTQC